MQRSSRIPDAPLYQDEWTRQKRCSSILMCWRLCVVTSGLVSGPLSFFRLNSSVDNSPAFNLSDGIETSLTAGLPPGLPTFVDMAEDELDGDYEPADGPPAINQISHEAPVKELPERLVKAYLVKYTSYRTSVGTRAVRNTC